MPSRAHAFPLRSMEDLTDYVVIDLETTGLSPTSCRIIQLSAVRYVDQREHSRFVSYVDPGCGIPPMVQQLTGITPQQLADAPCITEILPDYLRFIRQSPFLTGYNVSFDLSFLRAACGYDLSAQLRWFDTLSLARRGLPGLGSYRLASVCASIGYKTDFHDALNDCRACAAVLQYLCRLSPVEAGC